MARIESYFPKVLKYAGGFVNDPTDKGGATKYDVTLETWRNMGYDKDGDGDIDADDIKLLSPEDAMKVCKKGYWDRWKADEIHNQSVAESLVEWVWGSGKWGIIIPQRILNVTADGIVGAGTLAAVNNADARKLHEQIRVEKIKFIDSLIAKSISDYKIQHPACTDADLLLHTQKRFENGWKRRINEFTFQPQL